jgi:D-beta-D-heptose 7-phosphate kinase / D-beta-D-heptose 1-phosphate adenosyltransferase
MNALLDRLPDVHVAVIGDLMLDAYLYGDVSRISPEAPVPVMRATAETMVAGGAANVAANLAALGVRVNVVGLCGEDEARTQLLACLQRAGGVDCTRIVTTPLRCTTKKLRIIGARQQIVRVDHEDAFPCDPELEARCIRAATEAIDAADIVVLSDYGKGVCSDGLTRAVLAHARASGKQVIVDPKRRDFSAYRGASVLTPNRKELSDATGLPCESDEEAALAAARAQEACHADILLTRSEKGMSYFPLRADPIHLATVAREVFDVSGAGDTVVALLAAAFGARVPVVDAMRMANHAAGIVVSKVGTATVTRDEVGASMAAELASSEINDGRYLALEDAVALRWRWAREHLTVGVANGRFDPIHRGHVSLIRQAALACDRLIVALGSDDSVRRVAGSGHPTQDERSRAAVVGAMKGVSGVVVFAEDALLELIRALQPDVLVKGDDGDSTVGEGEGVMQARGGRVVSVPFDLAYSPSVPLTAAVR